MNRALTLSRWWALIAVARGVLAAIWLCLAPSAAAQGGDPGSFSVEGRIENGTAGATDPQGLTVTAIAFRREAIERTWETTQDTLGRYRFADLPVIDGATYLVLTEYQGAPYVGDIAPTPGAAQDRNLTVYESTATDPGLRFEQSAMVVSEVTGPPGSFGMTEIHSIVNATDRTFVPRSDGPGGPAGLLVFGLPPNAADLTPGLGLDPSRVVQIGRGFASLMPVPPGRTEISFSYRVPFSENVYLLERTIRYPVETMRVLAPARGIDVQSDQLSASGLVEIGGRGHRTLQGGPFAVGTTLAITVSGLPGAPVGLPEPVSPGLVGGAGTTIGLLAIAAHWWRTRRKAGATRGSELADLGPSEEGVETNIASVVGETP